MLVGESEECLKVFEERKWRRRPSPYRRFGAMLAQQFQKKLVLGGV